jgi:CubicO group peptidase (beta-lactamase class C family)
MKKMYPKTILAFVLFVFLFFGEIALTFSSKDNGENRISSSERTPFSYKLNNDYSTNSFTSSIDSIMEKFLQDEKIKGASVAISKEGKLVYAKGFGFADEENNIFVEPKSLFRIASVSKLVTAVGIMKLHEEGKIDLNARVFGEEGILTDSIFLNYKDKRVEDITVIHLLDHTAGWDEKKGDPVFNVLYIARKMGIPPPVGLQDIICYQLQERLRSKPGTSYHYSNFGYALLGLVIEKVTGMLYEDYIHFAILHPLGIYDMHIGRSFFEEKLSTEVRYYDHSPVECYAYDGSGKRVTQMYGGNDISLLNAAGGWVASAPGLLKFIVAIDGFPDKPDILSLESIEMMTQAPKVSRHLFGWRGTDGHGTWWRTGTLSGTTALVMRHKNEMEWVVLLNTTNKKRSRIHNELSRTMFKALNSVMQWPEADLFNIELEEERFLSLFAG